MLKTIARLRGKRRKKTKTGDSNSNDYVETMESADSGGSMSRNSSKNSMSDIAQCDVTVANGDVIDVIPTDDDSSDGEVVPKVVKPNTEIRAEDLYEVYNNKHADEDRLFRAEFQSMPAYVSSLQPVADYAKLTENKEKNRYKNVITCDDSRVKLSPIDDVAFSDYINASFIDGNDVEKKFIAAQGPKENTLDDFWRMIWEHHCYVIVMITELRELGRPYTRLPSPFKFPGQKKCEQYWPEDGTMEFGKIRVSLHDVIDYGSFVERLLKVTHSDHPDDEPRNISQFQYRAWPDHGVPKTTSEIFRFRIRTLKAQPDCDVTQGPIVVHCSAGVGRTGTYIVLDYLVNKLNNDNNIDVYDVIANLRTKRTEMVQSLDQYVFLHKLAMEIHLFGNTDVTKEDFTSRYTSLESEDPESGKTGFETEFDKLSLTCPSNPRLGSGTFPDNASKNRDQDIIPYEHSQIFIRMRPSEQTPPYANASMMQCYDVKHNVIVTQAPMQNTIEDFWRVVTDNYVTHIVMLTPLTIDHVEQCAEYWPISEDSLEVGESSVHNDVTIDHGEYIETTLSVSGDQPDHKTTTVTHLRYQVWEDENQPPPDGGAVLINLANLVAKQLNAEHDGVRPRVVIHCSDGAGRSGIFCCVINLLERLRRENAIDVFRSVKDLRDCRPLAVRTKEQYKACYDIIKEYITSSEVGEEPT
ncbi:receptor-type tyrosine-protein phosphatase alpha-like isoform X1 [Ciona intestinalis]